MQGSLQNGLHDCSKLISFWLLIPGVGSLFGAECEKRGMLIRVAGDNIMLSPPLIMTPDEVEEVRSHIYNISYFLCIISGVTD